MREKIKLSSDKVIFTVAQLYVLLPIVIFAFGWLKTWWALIILAALSGLFIGVYKSVCAGCGESGDVKQLPELIRGNESFWIAVLVVTGIWVYLSGIGGFAYQNDDFWVRNPIFYDLSTMKWPVVYDLSKESTVVQSICGSDKVMFAYYFCWWLPVSFLAKLFNLSEGAMNFMLLAWAWLGVLLTVYLLCRTLKRCSYVILIVLIGFSGMDAVAHIMRNNIMNITPWTTHIEWWAGVFQYSSMTTQLFWVFNQSIPVWLIVAIMLQLRDGKSFAAVTSLAFAYSPWATFGMVPYAVYASVKSKKDFRRALNVFNIAVPILMLFVFGTFYTAGTGSTGVNGWVFTFNHGAEKKIFANYLLFIFLEFGLYFIAMGKEAVSYKYYFITLAELIIFPLIVVRDYNFCMRASLPAIFITMVYVQRFLLNRKKPDNVGAKRARYILGVMLIIGMLTPLAEINRSINKTTSETDITQDRIGSFGDMQTDEEFFITTARDQFFVYDYEETDFCKIFGSAVD